MLGLARVGRIAPVPQFRPDKTECDADTVRAVITHRYYVLAQYRRAVRNACRQEIHRRTRRAAVRSGEGIDPTAASKLLRWLRLHTWDRRTRRLLTLDPVWRKDQLLHTVYLLRQELCGIWSRSAATGSATAEQSLKQLCDWRARAETSGIATLREFARRLPHLV
jgi:stearoyl-CoA desaturase (Delta-9 desaturase)